MTAPALTALLGPANMLERFVAGRSPADFPADDFETDFDGRATVDDLDLIGRSQLALPV